MTSEGSRLLLGIVDDAGLFPPASLTMREAVARHRSMSSPMLSGRFLVPHDRVQELLDELEEDEKLEVHLIGGPAPVTDPRLAVRALESREPVRSEIPCYVEGVNPAELAGTGFFGKVRCGSAQVPTVAELATYVSRAARHAVPFKATAGLHAAVRHGEQHGFFNVVVATSRAISGGDVAEALAETDGGALVDEASRLSPDQVVATRWLLHSFGSCDLAEPVAEASRLGLL